MQRASDPSATRVVWRAARYRMRAIRGAPDYMTATRVVCGDNTPDYRGPVAIHRDDRTARPVPPGEPFTMLHPTRSRQDVAPAGSNGVGKTWLADQNERHQATPISVGPTVGRIIAAGGEPVWIS